VLYGNKQGDLIMESGTDGTSDYWAVRFARGSNNTAPDTARMRLRPTSMQFFSTAGALSTGFAFTGGDIGLSGGNLNITAGALFTMGPGVYLVYDGVHIKGTINGGSSFTTLV
jgi:hypothetical protein